MRIKKVLATLGFLAVMVGVYSYFKKFSDKKLHESECKNDKETSPVTEIEKEVESEQKEEIKFEETKAESVQNMIRRHEEAASVMRDSLSNIYSEDIPKETENTKALDDIDKDLDQLLND